MTASTGGATITRPPHGCVARHVLEAHPHRYPWWPDHAVSCGTFHGAHYFRRAAQHQRAHHHHQEAEHEARHAHRPQGHAARHRAARRGRHTEEVQRRLRRRAHGGDAPAEEQPTGEPATEQELADARAGQPGGDVAAEEDPDAYGDPSNAEVQGEAEGAEEG